MNEFELDPEDTNPLRGFGATIAPRSNKLPALVPVEIITTTPPPANPVGRIADSPSEVPASQEIQLGLWIVSASVACYLPSLLMDAYQSGCLVWPGLACLLGLVHLSDEVWTLFPAWWANPLLLWGWVSLWRRREGAAAFFGIYAILLALWPLMRDFHRFQRFPGYWFWLYSVIIMTTGALALLFRRPLRKNV